MHMCILLKEEDRSIGRTRGRTLDFTANVVNVYNENGVLGDVNNDGSIDVKDVYVARIFAAKLAVPAEDEFYRSDVNGDGRINVIDANLIRKFAFLHEIFLSCEISATV